MPYVNLEGHQILPGTDLELSYPEADEEFSLVLSTYEESPCQAWLMLIISDLRELHTSVCAYVYLMFSAYIPCYS